MRRCLLDHTHRVRAFRCGNPDLDTYLRQHARKNAGTGIGTTHVFVPEDDPTRVAGYYTLAMSSCQLAVLPASVIQLPNYPVPMALIAKLAVSLEFRHRGLGSSMLLDAFEQVAEASKTIAVHAIQVDAIDDAAVKFYDRHEFRVSPERQGTLFISMAVVRDTLATPPG